MTKAYSMRLPVDVLASAKDAAAAAGESLTAYVMGALILRMTEPVLAPRGTDECAHPFRNEFGVCKVCGEER